MAYLNRKELEKMSSHELTRLAREVLEAIGMYQTLQTKNEIQLDNIREILRERMEEDKNYKNDLLVGKKKEEK